MAVRTRVLLCSAALTAIVLIAVPGSRSFASTVADKIVHLRPGATAGPIPFILDLRKHKRTANAPASHAKRATGQLANPRSQAPKPPPVAPASR